MEQKLLLVYYVYGKGIDERKGKGKERARRERKERKEEKGKGNKKKRKLSDYSPSNNIQ